MKKRTLNIFFVLFLFITSNINKAYASSSARGMEAFVEKAQLAMGWLRIVGIFLVTASLIWGAIEWMQGEGQGSKNIIVKTLVIGVMILLSPALINYIIAYFLNPS